MDIPNEVFFDIFSRLSIKDVLQCRCVCRNWQSIISNPQFADHHLETVDRSDRKRILIKNNLVKSNGRVHKYVTLPFTDDKNLPEFFSSCNGLVLVGTGEKNHFLWNPAIGSYQKLRFDMLHFKENYDKMRHIRLYGLGYDYASQAYKVVRIVRVICNRGYKKDFTTVKVYNCKSESCKKIDNFQYNLVVDGQGVILNGAPHWIVTRKDNENEYAIIYFDMAEDVIKEVETRLPSWLQVKGVKFRFGVARNSLCLVKPDRLDNAEVWVKKKDDICWFRLVKIILMPFSDFGIYYDVNDEIAKDFIPFRLSKNSEEVRFEHTEGKLKQKKLYRYGRYGGTNSNPYLSKIRQFCPEHQGDDDYEDEIFSFEGPINDVVFDTIAYNATLVSPNLSLT